LLEGAEQDCVWCHPNDVDQLLARRLVGTQQEQEDKAPHTVRGLLTAWLEAQQRRTDTMASTKRVREYTTRRLTRVLGEIRLEDLGAQHLEDFRDQAGAPFTLRLDLKDLRAAWRWAAARGWVGQDLPKVVLPEAKPARDRRTPTLQEAEQVAHHLQGWHKAAYELIFATGCRSVAMARLRWEHVDWETGRITLFGKGMRRRILPAPGRVLNTLRALWVVRGQPASGEVFTGARIKDMFAHRITRACKALGVERFTAHGLRRLRAREFRRRGVAVRVAASYLGHTPEMMLRVYDEASAEDLEAAMRACFDPESAGP